MKKQDLLRVRRRSCVLGGVRRFLTLWEKIDTKSKTVVYCKASLITELHDAVGKVGEEDVPVVASIGQRYRVNPKIFDTKSKTGVYCKASLIAAKQTRKQVMLGFLEDH